MHFKYKDQNKQVKVKGHTMLILIKRNINGQVNICQSRFQNKLSPGISHFIITKSQFMKRTQQSKNITCAKLQSCKIHKAKTERTLRRDRQIQLLFYTSLSN